uniref:Uncharacterized protein n=1 Tax=Nelumbo nucifera TaxID=4432 RepID=A0A822Z538_NELNU|nr:TPA_asm: hypothetical protein HUJ06_012897 [Nelumbo nucifera]
MRGLESSRERREKIKENARRGFGERRGHVSQTTLV